MTSGGCSTGTSIAATCWTLPPLSLAAYPSLLGPAPQTLESLPQLLLVVPTWVTVLLLPTSHGVLVHAPFIASSAWNKQQKIGIVIEHEPTANQARSCRCLFLRTPITVRESPSSRFHVSLTVLTKLPRSPALTQLLLNSLAVLLRLR